ncbi:MAG: condensation domain-containing protein, partial [Nostoc sp.]
PSSLPDLTIQYADFAIWQRQWLQTKVQLSQMAYWKQQLGGNLPVLQLPTDRPRPAIQTFRGRKQSWQISQVLTEALKSLSRREAVTLFMTLLAAFKTLLYRY